jgi:hypothetical protein
MPYRAHRVEETAGLAELAIMGNIVAAYTCKFRPQLVNLRFICTSSRLLQE